MASEYAVEGLMALVQLSGLSLRTDTLLDTLLFVYIQALDRSGGYLSSAISCTVHSYVRCIGAEMGRICWLFYIDVI
jgi:hypothetical protein